MATRCRTRAHAAKLVARSEADGDRRHMPARGILLALPIAAVMWGLFFYWIGWL